MTSRPDKDTPYLDTPQSNMKTRTTKDLLDQNSEIEILARMDPPDGFEDDIPDGLEEDISFQSDPNKTVQLLLEQLSKQLRETRAQMTAQQQELDSLKKVKRSVELEMAPPPVMEEVIKKTILENMARFDATLAPTNASMSRNFFASLDSAFESLEIKDDRQQTAILRSKMAQNDTTNSWISSITQEGKGPTSVAQWKAIIERDFRPEDLTEMASQKLNNLQMGKEENLLNHVGEFRKLMREANLRSSNELGSRFRQSLNPFWFKKLMNHPQYLALNDKTVEAIVNVLLEAFHQEESIRAHKASRYQVETKPLIAATTTTVFSNRGRTAEQEMAHQERIRLGLCHYCKEPGHRIADCPKKPSKQSRYSAIIDHTNPFLPVHHRKKAIVSVVDNKSNSTSKKISISEELTKHTSRASCNVRGSLEDLPVSVLIDSGSSSNIISEELATIAQLDRMPLKQNMEAVFANNSKALITDSTVIHMELGGQVHTIPSLIGPISQDVILGTPWLLENSPLELQLPDSITYSTLEGRKTLQTMPIEEVISLQNRRKNHKKRPTNVLPISWAELSHYKKGCHIFVVDLKRLHGKDINLETAHINELKTEVNPEATSYDTEMFNSLHPEAQILVNRYKDIFSTPNKLPPVRPEDIKIDLIPDATQPKMKGLGRINDHESKLLKETLARLLERKQIQVSTSPYGSRILFIKKSDGSLRLCVDYRELNALTIRNRCPIPNIGDLRDRVRGAKYFTKIDFRDGYYNLRVHPESISKTAFRSRYGLFEFTVMPFGLTNAPAAFSAMMNRIFGDWLDIFVISYLDDLVIFSKSEEEHINHVTLVLNRLRENKLYCKLSKCEFFKDQVTFCGHNISGTGVSITEDQIKAIKVRPNIKSAKDILKYLGLCVYFHDFIADYALITEPLTRLLKKKAEFLWTKEQENSISKLISAITHAPVLRYFDESLPTKVYSDASQYSIGGWIAQEHPDGWHPVVFVSRKLRPAEFNYTTAERELMALLYILEKQGHYLRGGIPFEANIDSKTLEHIQSMDLTNRRMARWILMTQDYNMFVKHISGKSNSVADYLTRNVEMAPTCHKCKHKIKIFATTLGQESDFLNSYSAAAAEDPFLIKVQKWWESNDRSVLESKQFGQFCKINNKWFIGKRLYVPSSANLRLEILNRYHDSMTAGHQGVARTRGRINRLYYWPGMENDIRNYVRSCDICQRHGERNSLLHGSLHPLPIPHERFTDISIDFTPVSKSNSGFDQLMVIVCRLTKLVRLVPHHKTDSSSDIVKLFIKNWYSHGFGLPETITSDRDTKFTSKLWTAISKQLGIKLELTTSRHQNADGQAEIAIRTYKRTAKKFASMFNEDWVDKLSLLEFALNNSKSASTGVSPFFLAFGFHPRVFIEEYAILENSSTEEKDLLAIINENIMSAKAAISRAHEHQSKQYNKKRSKSPPYKRGEVVYLDSEGINWPSYSNSPSESIPNYLGPFEIVHVDHDRDNVTLRLPNNAPKNLHPVFHVSKLKPAISRNMVFPDFVEVHSRPDPVRVSDTGTEFYEVEKIIQARTRHKRTEFLVKFQGYPDSHNEWYPFIPSQWEDWKDDWHHIIAFDPSFARFRPVSSASPAPRRSHRLTKP